MRRLIQKLLVLGAVATLATSASAFSLMGPFASWQTTAIGYALVGDIGGPMNLGEEYRLATPVLTYGYDATFLNYFGSNGVLAVEAAMAILNSVPAASAMSDTLAEFPLQARGPDNATAASLQVLDLKSTTLSIMLGQMGLASPERWTYALRERAVIANTTNYTVIQRNFDPVNWRPTNVVNGVLYTYQIQDPIPIPNYASAVEIRVSGNVNNVAVASDDNSNDIGTIGFLGPGQHFASLTRDDYGGLRYLLRFNNVNMETLPANITLVDTSSPYAPFLGTNITNLAGTNIPVATARRPGVERISFSPIPLDSLLNVSIRAVTNQYVDTYFNPTNGLLTNQTVQRVTTIPDVVFTASDLTGLFTFAGGSGIRVRTSTTAWVNNSAISSPIVVGGGINAGPGVIPAAASNTVAIAITFDTLGPSRFNFSGAGARFLDERNSTTNFVWGYFDATTIYSVFPDGLTIQDLERQLLGR